MAEQREDVILNVVVNQAESKNRLAEISKELKEIGNNQKQLNKDLQAGKITQDQYAASVTQNELALKKLRSEKNVLQRVVTAEKGSIDELKAAYIRLNAEINKTPAGQKVFGKSLEAARKEAAQLKDQINKAQQSVGNFSGNVGNYKSAFDGLGSSIKSIGASFGLAFGAAEVLSFFKEAAKGADEEAKAQESLLVALDGRVDIQERLIAQAEQLQNTRLFADDQTVAAQAELATLGLEADQIEALIPLVQDLATKKGVDLVSASTKVGKAVKGNADALKKDFGISVKGAKTEAERFAIVQKALNETVGGQAEAAARTGAGAFDLLNLRVGDLKDKVGEAINEFKAFFGLLTTRGNLKDLLAVFAGTFTPGGSGLIVQTEKKLKEEQKAEDIKTLNNLSQEELEVEKRRSEFKKANLRKEREELIKNNKVAQGRTLFGLDVPKADTLSQIDKDLAEQDARITRINGKLSQFNKSTNQLSDDVNKNAGEAKQALEELLRLRNEAALALAGGEDTEEGLKILEKQAEAELQKRIDLAKKAKGAAALTQKEIESLRFEIQKEFLQKRLDLQKEADDKQREQDEKAVEAALKITDEGLRKELEADRNALLQGEITREEFDKRAAERNIRRIEEEIKFREALGLTTTELEQQLSDKLFEIADNDAKRRIELQKTLADEQKKIYEGLFEAALQFSNTLGQLFIKDAGAAQRFNNAINALQNTFQAFFKIQQALDAYEALRSKQRVAQATAEAGAEASKGVAKQSGLPFPQNIIGIVTTVTAILSALATIGGAFKKFEAGGLLDGPSHKQGGIKGITKSGMPFEAEGGEYFVNKTATANNLPAIEAINKFGKTTKFDVVPKLEAGGILNDGGFTRRSVAAPVLSSLSNANLLNAISQMQFVVPVVDIETGLSKRTNVVSNSSLF